MSFPFDRKPNTYTHNHISSLEWIHYNSNNFNKRATMKIYSASLLIVPVALALPKPNESQDVCGGFMSNPACCSATGPVFTSCEART